MNKGTKELLMAWVLLLTLILGTISVVMYTIPTYMAWAAEKSGEGLMRKANFERQAQVAQARAEEESAQLRANAIAIVGRAAQEFPEYRQQEYIGAFARCMETGCASQIIYVPTEAGIPILEAGRNQRNN